MHRLHGSLQVFVANHRAGQDTRLFSVATAHVPCAGALPLSVIAGLVLRCRRWLKRRRVLLDMAALLATLQCLLVLAIWGLLPFRLWH